MGGRVGLCCLRFLGMRWRECKCWRTNPHTDTNASAHSYANSPAFAGRDNRNGSPEYKRTSRRYFSIPAFQH